MLNPKLKPLFNAAYLAIFLKFARKTYHKLNPYKLRFRRKYVLDIPFHDYIITVGTSNSLETMVKLANCILDKFPTLSLEVIDLSKMYNSFVNILHCNEATSISEVNFAWNGMPPKECVRKAISIFDMKGGEISPISEANARILRRIAKDNHQNARSTSLEELIA